VRPIIFISAVSRELRSARQLVANTLQLLGYEPDWQDIFGTEEGELRGMIRRRIDASAGVVQLVGQCYGAEPRTIDEQFGRVSYTQYEALYAKQRGKKVWYLLLDSDFTADPHDAEPEELRALQTAYRQRVREGDQLYHPLGSSDALEAKVLKLRDELAALRRRGKQWAFGVIALLILIVALVGLLVQRQVTLSAKMDRLLAQGVVQYPSAEAKAREAQPGQKPEQIEERAYAELARNLGIDAQTLREKLPAFAEQLKRSPDATTYERANAAFVAKDYAEAERLALNAAEEAQKADPPHIADALKALKLAGWSAQNRIEYARALNHFRAAAALTNRQRNALEWAGVQHEIASVLDDQGHSSEAETILRDVVNVREQVIGPEHPDTLRSRNNLANALWGEGKYAEVEAEYRAVLKLEEKVLGPEHPDTLRSRNNLAMALSGEGKYAEAEAENRAVLKLMEKVLGTEHPDTLRTRNDLARILATCPDAKIRNGSEAMALATNLCELSRWSDADYLDTLAAADAEAGLFDAAVKHQQQALNLAKASKVDVKDFESRLSLYQRHKPYRSAQAVPAHFRR
jgi:tetratricopeptide (TPR) repeat protein